VFPGIDHLAVRKGDRVRVRMGNLSMTSHPMHMHGYHFSVTCTDGGWVPESARWPETTINVPVGAMRAFEFDAVYEGDWAFHCHKSHHTMNAMGHNVKTYIGVNQKDIQQKIRDVVGSGYMAMGKDGMADMGAMEMPLPDNTLPMMTGFGQFGPIEMGGMFTVVKVREGLDRDDYKDPGWFKNPPGTVAYEWKGEAPKASHASDGNSGDRASGVELKAVKPKGNGGHSNH
jgi:hypothetical protein